jgi:5-oxoprolinase (ATP-hydrolysing)
MAKVTSVTRFYDEPAKYSGCSGTRTLADNISDLKAQVASWGVILNWELCERAR